MKNSIPSVKAVLEANAFNNTNSYGFTSYDCRIETLPYKLKIAQNWVRALVKAKIVNAETVGVSFACDIEHGNPVVMKFVDIATGKKLGKVIPLMSIIAKKSTCGFWLGFGTEMKEFKSWSEFRTFAKTMEIKIEVDAVYPTAAEIAEKMTAKPKKEKKAKIEKKTAKKPKKAAKKTVKGTLASSKKTKKEVQQPEATVPENIVEANDDINAILADELAA